MGEPPELLPGAQQYYRAFLDLCTDRPRTGFGAAPIPYSAVLRYAQFNGLDDPDEFEVFWSCITAMDEAWLKAAEEQAEAMDPNAPQKAQHSGRPMTTELFDALFDR